MHTLSSHTEEIMSGAVPGKALQDESDVADYVRVAAVDEGVIHADWLQSAPQPMRGFNSQLRHGDILVRSKSGRLVAAPVGTEHVGAYPTIDAFLVRPNPGVPPFFLVAVINAAGPIAATSAKPTVADIAALPVPDLPLAHQQIVAHLAEAVARERRLLGRRVALAEIAGRERIARALAADPDATAQPEGGTLPPDSPARPAPTAPNTLTPRRKLDL